MGWREGRLKPQRAREKEPVLAEGAGVFPLILRSTNCGGWEQAKSPMRLFEEKQ